MARARRYNAQALVLKPRLAAKGLVSVYERLDGSW
jgi:hypothetical protein